MVEMVRAAHIGINADALPLKGLSFILKLPQDMAFKFLMQEFTDKILLRIGKALLPIRLGILRLKVAAKALELPMQRRFPADQRRQSAESLHGIHCPAESFIGHKKGLLMIAAEARTVRAPLRAGIRDVNKDDLHILWGTHTIPPVFTFTKLIRDV